MVKLYLTVLLLIISYSLRAQPAIQWQKTFGGKGQEIARQLIRTADNGLLVAATANISDGDVSGVHPSPSSVIGSDGSRFYDDDIWLIKLDQQQNIVWQKCLGGNGSDKPTKLIETSNGDIIVVALTGSTDVSTGQAPAGANVLVSRLSGAGEIQWQKVFGGNGTDRLFSGLETANGDIILVGYTNSVTGDVSDSKGGGDGWIIRIDQTGNLIWKTCVGTAGYEELYAVAPTTNGYLAFGQATTSEFNSDKSQVWVTKVSDNGTLQWQRYPVKQGNPTSVAALGSDYIVSGYTRRQLLTAGNNDTDLWVARLDSAASLRWERTYGGGGEDIASSMVTLNDTTVIVAGSTSSNEYEVLGKRGQSADNWLLNIDQLGTLRWQYCLGGMGIECLLGSPTQGFIFDKLYSAASLIVDSDGGLILASYSQSSEGDLTRNQPYAGKPTSDVWVVKLAAEQVNPFQLQLNQPVSFCGRELSLTLRSSQPFATDNTFSAELSNSAGLFAKPVPLVSRRVAETIVVSLPDTLRGGFGYRVRVIANSPQLISAPSNRFNPATIPVSTIAGDATIKSGANAILQLGFTGGAPYSYTLSNGLVGLTNTESITVAVATSKPTTYTVRAVSNLCGTGRTQGTATIDVLYCTPGVFRSCQNSVRIEDLSLLAATQPLIVNKNSGCSGSNYGDFTRLPAASLARSGQYTINARVVGQNQSGNRFALWIDLNQDRQFTADERLLERRFSQSTTTINESFTIPSTAKAGPTRLRVYMFFEDSTVETEACYAYTYGEYEDYSVVIQQGDEADLSLSFASDKRVVALNEPVELIASLTNNGPQAASAVYLSNKLPANLTFVSSDHFALSAPGELTGTVSSIQAGETQVLSLIVRPSAAGSYTNWMQISQSATYDVDSRPNSGTGDGEDDAASVSFRTTDVSSSQFASPNPLQIPLPLVASNQPSTDPSTADLSLQMQVDRLTPRLNEVISYTLIVSNRGGAKATNVQLATLLPTGLAYTSSVGWTINDRTIQTTISSVGSGESISVSFKGQAIQSGTIITKAQILSAAPSDPDSHPDSGYEDGEDDSTQLTLRVQP